LSIHVATHEKIAHLVVYLKVLIDSLESLIDEPQISSVAIKRATINVVNSNLIWLIAQQILLPSQTLARVFLIVMW